MTRRQKAILKRNLFLTFCTAILILFICLVVFIISALTKDKIDTNVSENSSVASSQESETNESSSEENASSENTSSENTSSEAASSKPQKVELNGVTLDANYSNLLLVNGKNPLPEDYDYEGNLTTIPQKYIKGSLTQIDKDIWPYLQAMLDAARSENIDIGVWSPYRSYATQKMLFEKQVTKQKNNGVPADQAEDKAAKEAVEVRNRADSMTYQAEKQLNELGDKVLYEETGGLVDQMNVDGGRAAVAVTLEPGQISQRFVTTSGDGYCFVKLIEKTDSAVDYTSIKVPFTALEQRLSTLRQEGKVKEYITLAENPES